MRRVLPRLRFAGLALPFLTAGCMSGILPGSDAPDASCVLLCALARDLTGEPAPQQPSVAAVTVPAVAKPRARSRAVARHIVPKPPQRAVAALHPRPIRHKAPVQVSVVPQAPARAPAHKPVAMVPPVPAPVAVLPPPSPAAEPARDLSQAIPGSAGIMTPRWQGQ